MGKRISEIDIIQGKAKNWMKIPVSTGREKAETVDFNQIKDLFNHYEIVVGKAIPVGAMKYHWYYFPENANISIKNINEDTEVIIDGQPVIMEINRNLSNTGNVFTPINYHSNGLYIYRVVSYDENTMVLETRQVPTRVETLSPGVFIENKHVVCERICPISENSLNHDNSFRSEFSKIHKRRKGVVDGYFVEEYCQIMSCFKEPKRNYNGDEIYTLNQNIWMRGLKKHNYKHHIRVIPIAKQRWKSVNIREIDFFWKDK